MPENAYLPLNVRIPDITGNISLSDGSVVKLNPGYYAIYYDISATMKKDGSVKLTPICNDCVQNAYTGYARTTKRREPLVLSKYFIVEIHSVSALFFVWHSSAGTCQINVNLSIEKLFR